LVLGRKALKSDHATMPLKRIMPLDPAWTVRFSAMAAALVMALASGSGGAEAEVRSVHGTPTLHLDGRPVPPFAYMSYLGREDYYRDAASAGIRIYCIPAYLGDQGISLRSNIGAFRSALWRGEGAFDFSSLGDEWQALLRAEPQARVVVRLYLDPPQWWQRVHPEGCVVRPDGTSSRQSFTAPVWREATAGALRSTLRWLRESPYSNSLIGIQVAAGNTEEWIYHQREDFYDDNPARTAAFRDWLRETYGGDAEALREAWGEPQADFATARPADIRVKPEDRWRDPQRERPLLDTLAFHSAAVADTIAYFCRVVKQESQGTLLTGAFYGYHYQVGDPRHGHCALGRLLRCPDLDCLSSPNVYLRDMGEDWPPMAALASVALHGKLWLAENDTRTFKTTLLKDQAPHLCPPGDHYSKGVWLGPESAADSVALLRKNAARMLAGGYGGWWFDMWGGWFSDPRLLAVLRRTQELGAPEMAARAPAMAAQVAVVVDERLAIRDAAFGKLTGQVLANRHPLGKAGAPYDLYLRDDLARLPPGQHRFIWLLGIPELSVQEDEWVAGQRAAGVTVGWTSLEGFRLLAPHATDTPAPSPEMQLSPTRLRELWRKAGVHLYVDSDDVIHAGRGWLGLHTVVGGPRHVSLPFPARITDVFSGETLADNATSVELRLPPRSTTLLRVTEEFAKPRKADGLQP